MILQLQDDTNQYNMNTDLYCPVSLQPFTHPLVLDCGHTLDKDSFDKLSNKNKCPVCVKSNFTFDRINWSLVQALNLDIHVEKSSLLSAKGAAAMSESYAKRIALDLIENQIIPKVIQTSKRGNKKCIFICSDVYMDISKNIKSKLEELGYSIMRTGSNNIEISW